MSHNAESHRLSGEAGAIDVHLQMPASPPRFRALFCHPHPLYGGTMDNKVVTTVARTCRDAGGVVVRFNFRGVGGSAGAHTGGEGELEDLLVVDAWFRARWPALSLWLGGFSFGSFVAARGAARLSASGQRLLHVLLVAPPVHHYAFPETSTYGCPVTLIQGDADEVVPPDEVVQWATEQSRAPVLETLSGAGHFFHGNLPDLAALVRKTLPVADGQS